MRFSVRRAPSLATILLALLPCGSLHGFSGHALFGQSPGQEPSVASGGRVPWTAPAAAVAPTAPIAPVAPMAPSVRTVRTVRISGGVEAGNNLSKVAPVYPPEARSSGVQGTVVLHVLIDQEGRVQTATAISGPDALRQSAVEAVSQWVYQPFLLNGERTAVDTTVMVNYSLNP